MGGTISVSGSTKRTMAFLTKMQRPTNLYSDLEALAQQGVEALRANTPKDTGLTAESWSYEITIQGEHCEISWINTNADPGSTHIVILVQYGHGTGTGGYVQGRDFINPSLQPIFDKIAETMWKKVTEA